MRLDRYTAGECIATRRGVAAGEQSIFNRLRRAHADCNHSRIGTPYRVAGIMLHRRFQFWNVVRKERPIDPARINDENIVFVPQFVPAIGREHTQPIRTQTSDVHVLLRVAHRGKSERKGDYQNGSVDKGLRRGEVEVRQQMLPRPALE